MIENRKEAAFIAAGIALTITQARQIEDEVLSDFFEEHFERCFEETLQYRFHAEAFWIHQGGQGHEIFAGPWAEVFPSMKLALTLYCANVPVLAALIDTPKVEEAAGDPTKSRFESVNHDDDGGGTIYDKENFGTENRTAAAELESAGEKSGANAGSSAGAEHVDEPGAAVDPPLGSLAAGAGGEQLPAPVVPIVPEAEDVTENTDDESQLHPNAEVVVNDLRGEGGDVVDDDEAGDGEEGGGVEGDDDEVINNDPPAADAPKKNRKKKT